MTPQLLWTIRDNLPDILEIDRACFGDEAWDEGTFLKHLRERNCISFTAWVGEKSDVIGGYVVYELQPESIQILRLAVAPILQRQGIGRSMVYKLIDKLDMSRTPRKALVAVVDEYNVAAQCFLRECGVFWRCTLGGEYVLEYWRDGGHRNVWHQTNRVSGFYESTI